MVMNAIMHFKLAFTNNYQISGKYVCFNYQFLFQDIEEGGF